ncbi:hypothetical protein UFOVP361_80 [uncultured Caudovirales phage]|uniref:Uncharacterized protein n=1 Tax=uncultured Caudovirales phage TaxID=2100421 RepID=A0A6J7WWZ3_9CAUD|nr:hypothetical protein UFOVP361_80 [uncultured Caudovirales phage]
MATRKPSTRNNSRYWRKRDQVRPISPMGGGQGGMLSSTASNTGLR